MGDEMKSKKQVGHPMFWYGVRDDNTLEYTMIETHLAMPTMFIIPNYGWNLMEKDGKRWAEFMTDIGDGADYAIRIPIEVLEKMVEIINSYEGGDTLEDVDEARQDPKKISPPKGGDSDKPEDGRMDPLRRNVAQSGLGIEGERF